MTKLSKKIQHVFKKVLVSTLYKKYVKCNSVVQEDVIQAFKVRGCTASPDTTEKKFSHLMIYYSEFAFIFFWRIGKQNYHWKHLFIFQTWNF